MSTFATIKLLILFTSSLLILSCSNKTIKQKNLVNNISNEMCACLQNKDINEMSVDKCLYELLTNHEKELKDIKVGKYKFDNNFLSFISEIKISMEKKCNLITSKFKTAPKEISLNDALNLKGNGFLKNIKKLTDTIYSFTFSEKNEPPKEILFNPQKFRINDLDSTKTYLIEYEISIQNDTKNVKYKLKSVIGKLEIKFN